MENKLPRSHLVTGTGGASAGQFFCFSRSLPLVTQLPCSYDCPNWTTKETLTHHKLKRSKSPNFVNLTLLTARSPSLPFNCEAKMPFAEDTIITDASSSLLLSRYLFFSPLLRAHPRLISPAVSAAALISVLSLTASRLALVIISRHKFHGEGGDTLVNKRHR